MGENYKYTEDSSSEEDSISEDRSVFSDSRFTDISSIHKNAAVEMVNNRYEGEDKEEVKTSSGSEFGETNYDASASGRSNQSSK